jgi:hypothetical protein
VLICAGAAVSVLLGLPFLVDGSDGGQVAQVGVATAPGFVPSDTSATIMGPQSSKDARSQGQAQAGRSPRVDTTARRTGTTLPSRSGTTSVTTRPPLGTAPPTGAPATTAPPTATTAPPTPTTDPPPTTTTTTEPTTTTTTTEPTTTTTAPAPP